jgi:hypothetical protein
MRHVVYMAAYWIVVVIAIRLAVCFPRSLLARALFLPIGPVRLRGESHRAYLTRWARVTFDWSVQAAVLFVAGWLALLWAPSMLESLAFVVLWAVVIPLLGATSLLAAMLAMARATWLGRSDRGSAAPSGP